MKKKLNAQLKLLKSTNPAAYWNIINKGKKNPELEISLLKLCMIILR